MDAVWIILTSSLTAINCSLIGTYLVLRKLAMVGDAVAHAVLPGIVIAFLIAGSKTSFIVLLGAGGMGIVATLLVEFLHGKIRLQPDAAIGINFTWLFALGVILISFFSQKVDLDPECILYGEVAYVPLDTWTSARGTNLGPRAVYILAMLLLVNLGFILLSYKELAISTFDPVYATSIGINTTLWHYLVMAATSLTTVATFEIVGSVIVVALLVVPPATAYLLTGNLCHLLLIASMVGILTSISGYYLAVWVNGSIAGAMATMAGGLFGVALVAYRWKRT
mmetsp:Transcript_8011/g.18581  ORF Transcript_8011/g.18581 Transcript_8011/m.18581 type:complete len:281 (+) Transcript_8011:801-1643(+)